MTETPVPSQPEASNVESTENGSIERMERDSEMLLDAGRAALGVAGKVSVPSLRQVIRHLDLSWYPLFGISMLALMEGLQRFSIFALGPSISGATGVTRSRLDGASVVGAIFIGLAAAGCVVLVRRRPWRAVAAVVGTLVWAILFAASGLTSGVWPFTLALVGAGLGAGIAQTAQRPLLMDAYPPEARLRCFSIYWSALALGSIASVGLVWLLCTVFSFTWRTAFLVLGGAGVLATLLAVAVRDPGLGHLDDFRIRELAWSGTARRSPAEVSQAPPTTHLGDEWRLVLRAQTLFPMLLVFSLFGLFLGPLQTYLSSFLEWRWGLTQSHQWAVYAACTGCASVALVVLSKRAEILFRTGLPKLLRLAAASIAVASVALFVATRVGVLPITLVLLGVAFVGFYLPLPVATVVILSVLRTDLRLYGSALMTLMFAVVSGAGGGFLLGSIDSQYGFTWTFLIFMVIGLAGAGAVFRVTSSRSAAVAPSGSPVGAAPVEADLNRLIEEVLEDEELHVMVNSGSRFPLLGCRRIDFSYGQLQVLFGVNLTVDEGQMVALLGTNGAGKSTLLRVISGLGAPNRGTVHYCGSNITNVDAERRVGMGISQVPGGRAIFGSMKVIDNLRAYGYGLKMSRTQLERSCDEVFDILPPLAHCRDRKASVLSGGEQQMLALAKVLMRRPRLLLIDELSLGLAPIVVGQLLDMVRRINTDGTAVVLVEQSVNIALSLADQAFFMEKGEIRFNGPTRTLLERPDLLRSVFLEGAEKGLEAQRHRDPLT